MPVMVRALGLAGVVLALAGGAKAATLPPLLPVPAAMTAEDGGFPLASATIAAGPAGDRFADLLRRSGGARLKASGRPSIRFVTDARIAGAEAYRLDVTPAGITVAASTPAGLFYGAETLWQLAASARDGRVPAVHIEDQPAFAWRGLMLDSVRHFQSVAFIEQLLDRMAEAKLNVFHWHLTDDQGWRLPVPRYPRLTSVGAWRSDAGTGARSGGFYTEAEIRSVVAYAAARHITVVPEIEMPGHATALIAAYPALGSTASPPAAPSHDWGILPNLLNTEDTTFRFMEDVLDQVMALFPGRYIHVGGDEAPKDQWRADPRAQARIRALGLKDENALQGWFTARIGEYLEAHGRRLIGWDEILEGGVPADAAVMSWRGIDGAIKAARAGHDTVLAPSPILYLDNRQSDAADETPGRGALIDWRRIYGFDIAPAALTPDERRHILGVQSTLFTEHARTEEQGERMIWPRAAEVAELGWSPVKAQRDWAEFGPRLIAALGRWDRLGWSYDRVPIAAEAPVESAGVTLAQPAGIGTLRYTTDGSAPTAASPAYTGPIPRTGTVTIAAQAFLGDQPLGLPQRWSFDDASLRTRIGAHLELCANKLPLRLEDEAPLAGERPIHWIDVMKACWIWRQAPVDGATRISALVGSVPYNFALGADMASVTFRPPATPAGELEVRQDGCDGPRIAVLPLAPAAGRAGETELAGRLAPTTPGMHDLCMTFTQKQAEPLWTLDRLTIDPAPAR